MRRLVPFQLDEPNHLGERTRPVPAGPVPTCWNGAGPDGRPSAGIVGGAWVGALVHLRLKPLLQHVPLEAPLAADLGRRHLAAARQLVDRHDVQAEVLGYLAQRHDLTLVVVRTVFVHRHGWCLTPSGSMPYVRMNLQDFYLIFMIGDWDKAPFSGSAATPAPITL